MNYVLRVQVAENIQILVIESDSPERIFCTFNSQCTHSIPCAVCLAISIRVSKTNFVSET
jgi:hypothetical protein